MPPNPLETNMLDTLGLRLNRQTGMGAGERRELRVDVLINELPFQTHATDVSALARSVVSAGEFFIDTCTCGAASCADVFNGVVVRHEPAIVVWYVPATHTGAPRFRRFRFDYGAYREEVERCLRDLAEIAWEADADGLIQLGDHADVRELLREVSTTPAPTADVSLAPQGRLLAAIEEGNSIAARCALADGADLLNDPEGVVAPWQRAVTLHCSATMACPEFLIALVQYLPTPIPESANPDWLLDEVVEDGPAEVLQQFVVAGGPVPLTRDREQRCLARLEDLRASFRQAAAMARPDDVDQWRNSNEARRGLLEVELKVEAIDRSAVTMAATP